MQNRFKIAICAFFALTVVIEAGPNARAQETAATPTVEDPKDPDNVCERTGTDAIAPYAITKGKNIAQEITDPLAGQRGSPLAGRDLMVRPDRGNCTSCHAVKAIRKKASTSDTTSITRFGLQGTVGPALDGVAKRYTEGELRLLVVNPQIALPEADSIMPAYHYVQNLKRVKAGCEGRAILTAGEVEDIVAYLTTLTDAP